MRQRPSARRCGTATSSTPRPVNPTSSTSTSTSCTKSRSPQAFDGLRLAGRTVRRPDLTVATEDHNVPTDDIDLPIADPMSAQAGRRAAPQRRRVRHHASTRWATRAGHRPRHRPRAGPHPAGHDRSCAATRHTSTHGAFGALAFGIGTSEVEHVLATQTLPAASPAKMDGGHRRRRAARPARPPRTSSSPSSAASAPAAASATSIEYRGSAIRALSMEGRMTVCNMSIEAGAKAGLVAPDDTTFAYLEGRPPRPEGTGVGRRPSTTGARSSPTTTPRSTRRSCSTPPTLRPHVSWGTNPGQVVHHRRRRPRPRRRFADPPSARPPAGPLAYMGLDGGHADPRHRGRHRVHRLVHQQPHRGPARRGRRRSRAARSRSDVRTLVVPGSHAVKAQAEAEGLDDVFRAAGFDWREPGLLDVPRHEPRQARGRRAVRVDVATATSKAARAAAAAPTSSPPPSPPPPPSPATSPPRRTSDADRRPFTSYSGTAVPLDRSDVDTDQIIPSDWLKRVERTGFGKGLFAEWRDDRDVRAQRRALTRAPRSSSPARTSAPARRASTRCGRSMHYGFEAVISPRFGDIFRNNCTKNGLVPVVLPRGRGAAARRDRADPTSRSRRRRAADRRGAGPRARRRVPARRPDPAPLPGRPRRHRDHPEPRRGHRFVRARSADVHAVTQNVTLTRTRVGWHTPR